MTNQNQIKTCQISIDEPTTIERIMSYYRMDDHDKLVDTVNYSLDGKLPQYSMIRR